MKGYQLLKLIDEHPERYYNTKWDILEIGTYTIHAHVDSNGRLKDAKGMPVSISQNTTAERICEWKSLSIFELVDRLNSVYSNPERKKDFSFSCEYEGKSYHDIQEIHSLDWFLRLAARGQWFIKETGEIE